MIAHDSADGKSAAEFLDSAESHGKVWQVINTAESDMNKPEGNMNRNEKMFICVMISVASCLGAVIGNCIGYLIRHGVQQ